MFSDTVQEHSTRPRNLGPQEDATVTGRVGTPGEGPFLLVHLSVEHDTIATASFETYGCPVAIACGSWLTQWAKSKTLVQAALIEPGDLERVLGGLPLGKEHCAALAVNALKDALRQCSEKGTSS
jgi:nitrogen fixation NifU-like protein